MTERLRLRGEGLTWREVDGELVVLDLGRSVYLASNRTGAPLWRALVEGTTREALVSLVVETFDVPWETATDDVEDFLNQMARLRLLEA